MNTQYALRRLSLPEQWRSDPFRIIFMLAMMVFWSAIIVWILPLFSHGNTQAAFIGMLSGLSVNFWLTCIARLRIEQVNPPYAVIALLERFNYQQTADGYYDLKLAGYKKFKAQRIYLTQQEDTLVITGPCNVLKKIIKNINPLPLNR
ncbi:hypothetical protein [Winslowiella iniecta]|uniref:Uncharacterized protein n=1 Tax=Winslowiella iniecta TaxID=1560201 RepID=A0A0L7TET3_9GAMM|nr:hypothetical protein [Winslowiella iniecta]KOC89577.1 hypothetical protein NG42_12090 [Winslowiella iniecta]KOC93869.1 hypothetical protein NG43_07855 [Winslowiella iniecta]